MSTKTTARDHATGTFAYKTYLATKTFTGEYAISKGGYHISYARTPELARQIIDSLVDLRATDG